MTDSAVPHYFVASWPKRITAYWIDSIITWFCLLPVWIQLIGTYFTDGAPILSVKWLIVGILLALFYQWMFLYFLGGTLGKLLVGLRVVSIHQSQEFGQDLGLFQSLLRVLTNGLSIFFGDALRALAFLRLDRRHVGDWVAETRVVQSTPLGHFPRRHWVLGIVIFFLSFTSSFRDFYTLLQKVEVVGDQIVYDADR
jgi:uncharacterized RDD family membrane protein YckC